MFLGGAAVAIGLPFLETLTPRKALGQAAAAPKRFLGYFMPNGFDMDDFRPIGPSGPLQLGLMMQAAGADIGGGPGLEPLKEKLLVITGLQNTQQCCGPGDHSGGIGSFMTNRTVPNTAGAGMGGPSIDYLISQSYGNATLRPYFVMGGEPPFWQGDYCDSGYPCAVANHITFDMQGNNIPRIETPGEAFDQLFGGLDPTANSEAALRRAALETSILDLVDQQATSLAAKLSAQDKPRLEEYLTSIREVEMRISANPGSVGGGGACTPPTRVETFDLNADGSVSGDHLGAIQISHELMAIGLQCDSTRVMSFMWGNMTSARNYSFIGAAGGHHDISHHGGGAESVGKLKIIGRWELNRFAEFLQRLDGMIDVDGNTVLDNTLVFLSSDISDGDAHNHDDMPVILAGNAAGFTMGRHLEANGAWFGDLFISIAAAYGLQGVNTFGEMGTGPLAGLTV
jgi:hypothetical protein